MTSNANSVSSLSPEWVESVKKAGDLASIVGILGLTQNWVIDEQAKSQ
jgi:hypothetical protein